MPGDLVINKAGLSGSVRGIYIDKASIQYRVRREQGEKVNELYEFGDDLTLVAE